MNNTQYDMESFKEGWNLFWKGNYVLCRRIFEKAAISNYPPAILMLTRLYMKNDFQNTDKINILFEKCKSFEDWFMSRDKTPEHQYYISLFYSVVFNDENAAKEWCLKSAAANYGPLQYRLATLYDEEKNAKESHYWSLKAAHNGIATAQFNVAWDFERGTGVQKDISLALYWYHKAAEQECGYAQKVLADFYLSGKVVPKDEKKAHELYQKAASNGLSLAMWRLGCLCEESNPQQAWDWFVKSAECDDPKSMLWIAQRYQEGERVPQDLVKAAYWFQKAAEWGEPQSQFGLAECLENGSGIKRDLNKAYYWYQKAADKNVHQAEYVLGRWHEIGITVEKDMEKALSWYRKCAKDFEPAALKLGLCYQNGDGVEQDLKKALEYFKMAGRRKYYEPMLTLYNCQKCPKQEDAIST